MDMSNTQKRGVKTYGEQDAYTEWRKLYCYLSRAGAVKSIKRMTHKRERRGWLDEARAEATRPHEDDD